MKYYHFICEKCGPEHNYVIIEKKHFNNHTISKDGKIPERILFCNHKKLITVEDREWSPEKVEEARELNKDYHVMGDDKSERSIYLLESNKLKKCYDKCD